LVGQFTLEYKTKNKNFSITRKVFVFMKKPNKEDIMKKWTPILESMGMTGSKLDILSQLTENQSNQILKETKSEDFQSLLPIAMKVASRTMSNDLIFASKEEIDLVKSKVKSENRDGKIESIIEGGEFTEKKLEDDEEYKELMKKGVTPMSAPSGMLFYLDYKYESVKSHKKTRRSKKKNQMGVFKSPGVYIIERDIAVVKHSKRYSRRIKIGKIFDIEVTNKVIITSTTKGGPTNFPQICE